MEILLLLVIIQVEELLRNIWGNADSNTNVEQKTKSLEKNINASLVYKGDSLNGSFGFNGKDADKIDDALDELGDDFTEEEVRLVRIKFISEMAN